MLINRKQTANYKLIKLTKRQFIINIAFNGNKVIEVTKKLSGRKN